MKASHNATLWLLAFGFLASSSATGAVVIPGNFSGTSDSTYAQSPANAVERAALAARNAAWQQSYGNCTLSNYNYWPSSLHYAASANVACTKPGEPIPIVVIFTFTGATDPTFDIGLDQNKAVDTAVMRAEAAAGADGYSQCVLKNYSSWQPNPPSQSWMASAVVDCKKSVSSIPVG
ncbi:hypothetical protein [Xanthomonas bonasiae]|uniref:hypothetical protein n=1 Tax=Xanthomonas bonasiae TaxID=2810351 RepID=UPI00177EC319|nr:hypothetical protein [Xanthomonas surreyensis]MBD7922588.1 hypothetical protein [Xanthomonas surreyensis]